jgi:two-component system LytT family response regulator
MLDAVFRPLPSAGRALPREFALGFIYWLAFVLLLEPGNVLAAQHAGRSLDVGREALRMVGAAALGGAATPLTLWLVRRYPVRGDGAWRNALLHTLACVALAALLIVVSCPLAAWFIGDTASLPDAIRSELSANWALLFYGLATLTAASHAIGFRREAPGARTGPDHPARIAVTSGRRTLWLDLAAVDWVEAQGNYVAFHAGGAAHLVRGTLGGMEARLDPRRFARIHRRIIVAVDRVEEVVGLDGGDADVRLQSGVMLRLSRTYRDALRARL